MKNVRKSNGNCHSSYIASEFTLAEGQLLKISDFRTLFTSDSMALSCVIGSAEALWCARIANWIPLRTALKLSFYVPNMLFRYCFKWRQAPSILLEFTLM